MSSSERPSIRLAKILHGALTVPVYHYSTRGAISWKLLVGPLARCGSMGSLPLRRLLWQRASGESPDRSLYTARSTRLLVGGIVEVAMLAERLLATTLFPSGGGNPRRAAVERVPSRCSAVFGSGECFVPLPNRCLRWIWSHWMKKLDNMNRSNSMMSAVHGKKGVVGEGCTGKQRKEPHNNGRRKGRRHTGGTGGVSFQFWSSILYFSPVATHGHVY
jgi:hypothetical protein